MGLTMVTEVEKEMSGVMVGKVDVGGRGSFGGAVDLNGSSRLLGRRGSLACEKSGVR
jgi:hypothetical protein